MTRTIIQRTIDAPASLVFETIAHAERFASAIPGILGVEFLTERRSGVGTRFRETRVVKGRESATELEVTEFVQDERIRLIADSNGTIWDTLFTVWESGGQTHLEMMMDARAYRILPRLLNPLMKGLIKSAIAKDIDTVKEYCETHRS